MPKSKQNKPKSKRKVGRPKLILDLVQVERLAMIGCTEQEIADVMGIGIETINRRKKDSEEFREALKKGRAQLKMSLRRKQLEKAMGGNTTMLIWLGKQILGQRDMPDPVYEDTDESKPTLFLGRDEKSAIHIHQGASLEDIRAAIGFDSDVADSKPGSSR